MSASPYPLHGVAADPPHHHHPLVGLALRAALLCIAYYLCSLLGYALIFPSSYISIIWPPNTILLVALLLSARRQWPWLLLTVLPVHLVAQAHFGVSATVATLYYAYDCALVLLTAWGLQRAGLGTLVLSDVRRAVTFLVVTTMADGIATLVWSPLIVQLTGRTEGVTAWLLVFLSNLLPFLVAAPGFVLAARRGRDIIHNASLPQYTEFGLLAVGLLACAIGVFGVVPGVTGRVPALVYAPLPFLLWATVRFGLGGLSFAFLIFALMAMFNATAGYGPFVTASVAQTVLQMQFFLLALYVPLLVMASVVEERRGKEEALKRSEARYRAVVHDQTELICRFLPDGRYTFVNDAYCQYFGSSPGQLLGKTFWAFIPPEGHQAARDFLATITPNHPVATREHEVVTPGGEFHWQQWRDRGFFDEQGNVVEYQAVGRDITERKRLEDATQRLAHASRLAVVGELTASIAHEINQPLTAILTNAAAGERLLRRDSPSLEEVREVLGDIRKDDVRACQIIERIKALVRRREMAMLPIDLNEVADEVVRLVAVDARHRRVELRGEFAPAPAPLRGDRVHLQQVLLNLLMNAMDAVADSPSGSRRVLVRTETDGRGSVLASVTDTGHGIPPDRLPRIFESFFTTKQDGMGLGLAISHSIIEAHGGRIWASNDPSGGATFHFTLPVAPDAAEAPGEATA
jgi:PAS domain S-box-containing protein